LPTRTTVLCALVVATATVAVPRTWFMDAPQAGLLLGVLVGVTPLSRLAGGLVRPASPDEPAWAALGPPRR
jgi:hypothetical protein